MSTDALSVIEGAIKARMAEDYRDAEMPVLGTYVVAWTEGHIHADNDGTLRPSWVNDYVTSDSEPNAAVGLAHWLARKLDHDASAVCDSHCTCEDDD